MLNRGRSQNFQNLNFLHIFVDLQSEAQVPRGIRLKSFQYEMREIFIESLVHETLFNTVVYGSNETHIKLKKKYFCLKACENFSNRRGMRFFIFYFYFFFTLIDLCLHAHPKPKMTEKFQLPYFQKSNGILHIF